MPSLTWWLAACSPLVVTYVYIHCGCCVQASPPRRRRRNNEAYVCIFAPPSDSGQRPHVAVAVYTRSSERNASGSDSGPADALAAMVGQHPPNSGADGPQTNEASDGQLSGML